MNLWTTTLRLNLDKSDHRKAWEVLKKSDMSHTKFIVAAVLAYAENESNNKILLSEISKIIKAEIGEALKNCNSEPDNISENESRLNTEYNILCSNPDEKNIDNIKSLKITEICGLLNYDKSQTGKFIDHITELMFESDDYEQSLCSITQFNNSGKNNYRIFINPRIIYNGSNYKKVEILCTFGAGVRTYSWTILCC